MSQENMDVVRAAMAAWNEGEMSALRDLLDRDMVLRPPEGWPEPGPYVGVEAAMREWEQLREIWKADAIEPIGEFTQVADHVLVRARWRTAGSGPKGDMEMTIVYTLRGGRIFLNEYFWRHEDALRAVGLEE